MANTNPVVTSLKGYVDQETNKEQLIAKTVLGAKSASLFTLQTGVKGPTTINTLTSDVVFGDGSVCGFEDAGTATISQRKITPAVLKVNMGFCDRNLLQTYAQYQIKLQAGLETMPFEEQFTSEIVNSANNKLETMVWQGDSANTAGNKEFDGILKIAKADGALTVTGKKTAVWAAVQAAYAKLPEDAIADDTVIFVASDLFRALVQELIAANLYHYNESDSTQEITLPGTNVRVIGVRGLVGAASQIVAGRLSNFFYGTDLDGSSEEFKIVYDEVKEQFLLKILFSAGVQIAFPNQVVVATLS